MGTVDDCEYTTADAARVGWGATRAREREDMVNSPDADAGRRTGTGETGGYASVDAIRTRARTLRLMV